jgi:hypothetical protein
MSVVCGLKSETGGPLALLEISKDFSLEVSWPRREDENRGLLTSILVPPLLAGPLPPPKLLLPPLLVGGKFLSTISPLAVSPRTVDKTATFWFLALATALTLAFLLPLKVVLPLLLFTALEPFLSVFGAELLPAKLRKLPLLINAACAFLSTE